MNRKWIVAVVLFIICLSLWAGGQRSKGEEADTLLIGAVMPFTGDNALHGEHFKMALEMASEEINAKGGIGGKTILLTYGDDKADPNEAATVAQKFVTLKDLFCVIGSAQSSCSLASQPIYEREKVTFLSPCNTNPKLTESGFKYYFRTIPRDDLGGPMLAEVAVKDFGKKRLSIIFNNDDYGRGTSEAVVATVRKLGGTILSEDGIMGGKDKEFTPILTKIQTQNPDAVVLIVEYIDAALIMRQANNIGLKVQFIGSSSVQHPEIAKLAGVEASEGLVSIVYYDPFRNDPISLDFTKRFQARYNTLPTEQSGFGYELLYILKQAYEEDGGTTREKLPAALRKVVYTGVTGVTRFDDKGDVIGKKPAVIVMKNGNFGPYTP